MSFLLTKLSCFDPTSNYKAYSYCGTICKNYLIYKINLFTKNQKRNESYDSPNSDAQGIIENSISFSYSDEDPSRAFINELTGTTVKNIKKGWGNIAGVKIPIYEGADFGRGDYDLYSTPLWIDMAADRMEKELELDLEAEVLDEQVRLLSQELRTTTQRVNLFEKVKIPETKRNIKKIGVFLGDEQVAAVVRSKISKKKLQAVADKADEVVETKKTKEAKK
jgi:H(+)-transporting ATP synthase subunit D